MNDLIMKKMGECCACNAVVTFADGNTMNGYVDNYESRYDNDGEASICFAGENGEMIIIEEHEISDIMIIDKWTPDILSE